MDKYKVFLEKCSATNISGDIATALWALFVQLPFNLFSFILQLLVYILKVLNLGHFLNGLQNTMIETSKNVFTALIGGETTFIGSTSFVGLAVLMMSGYLLYQFTNGKGKFISSLVHFACIFALVFFYFGTFTSSETKAESGGRFLFQTIQNVTDTAQSEITKALNPTVGSNDPTKVYTTYLKNASNTINTGNVDGKLKDGKTFDYDKASGSDGESYLSDLAGDNRYIQANNDVLVEKITFGLAQSLDAYVMVLPMAVIDIIISILSLVLLLLILLFPLTAALSFFPFFRNAAVGGLKKMILLTVLPTGLSILMSLLLYLLGQIDAPVTQAVATAKVPSGFSFLVTLVVELLLKAAMLYGIWRYRDFLLDFLTGGQIQESGFGNSITSGIKNTISGTQTVGHGVKEGAVGGFSLATGTALMAGGGLAFAGASLLGQEALTQKFSEVAGQGKDLARSGLGHFVPNPLKEKFRKAQTEEEEEIREPEESDTSVSQTVTSEHSEDFTDSKTEASSDKTENLSEDEEDLEIAKNKAHLHSVSPNALNPFVLPEEQSKKNGKTNNNEEVELSENGLDSPNLSAEFSTFDAPIMEEESSGEWEGAIQDMNHLREEV
jgi:hypothetical protein